MKIRTQKIQSFVLVIISKLSVIMFVFISYNLLLMRNKKGRLAIIVYIII